jgi:hypothetical protein
VDFGGSVGEILELPCVSIMILLGIPPIVPSFQAGFCHEAMYIVCQIGRS